MKGWVSTGRNTFRLRRVKTHRGLWETGRRRGDTAGHNGTEVGPSGTQWDITGPAGRGRRGPNRSVWLLWHRSLGSGTGETALAAQPSTRHVSPTGVSSSQVSRSG